MRAGKARTLTMTALLVALLAAPVFAITWFPKEFTCPVCKTKNTFMLPASWGDYIYHYPSKYQYIYWPLTDSPTVHTCKKCHLSVFMWDQEKLPADKIPLIAKQLEGVVLKDFKEYTEVPVSRRLEIAERVYKVLGRDDDFWCTYYRALAYHHDAENNPRKADEARTKALELANKMLNDPNNPEPKKELLFIAGAMKHFLRDDEGAVAELKKAVGTRFSDKRLGDEQNQNGEQNLTALAEDYIKKIQGPDKPRLAKAKDSH